MSQPPAITIVRDSAEPLASQPPVTWAIDQLQRVLSAKGIPVDRRDRLEGEAAGSTTILIAGPTAGAAQSILTAAGAALPDAPEALALAEGRPISQWRQREIADEILRRGIVPTISPRHAGRLVKRGTSNRTWCATG